MKCNIRLKISSTDTMRTSFLVMSVVFCVILDGCISSDLRNKRLFSLHFDSSIPRKNCAVIIPGMYQTCSSPGYDSIGSYYKSQGMLPVYVNWTATGISHINDAAAQLSHVLKDSFPDSRFFLFGFSFGAVISLKLSQVQHVEHILLCSMSPLFSEDIHYQYFPFKQLLGIITGYSANELSYSLSRNTCVHFLYGEHDSFVINKSIIQNRKHFFRCNETDIVSAANHTISGKTYLAAIRRNIQRINCDSPM